MNQKKTVLKAFGGISGIALLIVAWVLVSKFISWDRQESGAAIGTLAEELGLTFKSNGKSLHVAQGYINDVRVTIKTTYEGTHGSSSDNTVRTLLMLSVPYSPPGRIEASSWRQSITETWSEQERVITGDASFDQDVYVVGPPDIMLAHLDADARKAISAATAKGWGLKESSIWEWRENGHIHDKDHLRSLMNIGLSAALASRMKGDIVAALRERAKTDPESGVRAAASSLLDSKALLLKLKTEQDASETDAYYANMSKKFSEKSKVLKEAREKKQTEYQAQKEEIRADYNKALEILRIEHEAHEAERQVRSEKILEKFNQSLGNSSMSTAQRVAEFKKASDNLATERKAQNAKYRANQTELRENYRRRLNSIEQ